MKRSEEAGEWIEAESVTQEERTREGKGEVKKKRKERNKRE